MKEYNLKINGKDFNVGIQSRDAAKADVVVNGMHYEVEISGGIAAGKPVTPVVAAPAAPQTAASVAAPKSAAPAGEMSVKSPLPGVILDIKIKEGDTVAVGQTLVVLEAMKMENNVESDRAGVVKSIKVKTGDSVMEGDVLISLE